MPASVQWSERGFVAVIELTNLTKVYAATRKGGAPTVAVEDVSLSISRGEFCAVVGPSGCGKTTVLNLVAGFEKSTQGQVLIDGTPVTRPGPERAVVFQQPSLLPWMTVHENVGFGLTLRDKSNHGHDEAIGQMIDIMGLEGFEHHYPYQLSGGMQQRAAIGRALITEPTMLLMDEPFGALDAQTRSEMQRFLLELWRSWHPTVLFITHDVDEAILLSDRIVVMTPRPGTIAAEIPVTLKRPRQWDVVLSQEFLHYKKRILSVLRREIG